MTVMQGGAIHGDEFRDVASRPVGADSVQGIMTRRPVGAVPESMMNSGAALATRPPCLDRVSRLVVVSETSDLPPWIRGWWRGAGRDLEVHCVPATVPGHRLAPVHLLSEIAELLADPVLVIQPGSDGTGLPEVIAALHDLPDDAPVLAAVADIAQHLGSPVVLIHGLPVSFAERSVGLRPAMQHGRRLLDAAARRRDGSSPTLRTSASSPGCFARTPTSWWARTSTPACSSLAAHAAAAPTTSAWWHAPPCIMRPARCWSSPADHPSREPRGTLSGEGPRP
jgi:hypothetical protein